LKGSIRQLGFFPNTLQLASLSEGGEVEVWNVDGGSSEVRLDPSDGAVGFALQEADLGLALGAANGQLRVTTVAHDAQSTQAVYTRLGLRVQGLNVVPQGALHATP
jgi:hypothetical protein